ncbi:MAG TPA: zinc ribbon domain-containing protein [Ktedonosporobacter sp.]|nr:zinc ribbon domain-containing protein [Ktedonosporobacter sp.]
MTIYQCPQCHKHLKERSNFCHHCGAKLPASDAAPDISKQSAHAASQDQPPKLPRVQFREPTEGAFTALVPQAWQTSGRLVRNPLLGTAAINFVSSSDENGTVMMVLPGITYHFQEIGIGMFGAVLPGRRLQRYMPAPLFTQHWLVPQLARMYRDMRVEHIVNRPDLLPLMAKAWTKDGTSLSYLDLSAVEIQFTSTAPNGICFRYKMAITVVNMKFLRLWQADLAVILRAPQDQFAQWEPLLTDVAKSVQLDPQWDRAELMRNQMRNNLMQQQALQIQQNTFARQQAISNTLSQTSDIISQGYWERQAVLDHNAHRWSNAILGNQDVMDSSGQVFQVQSGYDQYWRDNLNNIYVGNWLANPGPGLEKLKPTGD